MYENIAYLSENKLYVYTGSNFCTESIKTTFNAAY